MIYTKQKKNIISALSAAALSYFVHESLLGLIATLIVWLAHVSSVALITEFLFQVILIMKWIISVYLSGYRILCFLSIICYHEKNLKVNSWYDCQDPHNHLKLA